MIAKFNTLSVARNYSYNTVKASIVILGDDNLFWVCTLGYGQTLVRAGYEVAA